MSIQRADASVHHGRWQAELAVTLPDGVDAQDVPFAELVDLVAGPSTGALRLISYRLGDSSEYGGTLKLEVEALDSIGLLARVLGLLAMLSLFPVAIRIETRQGRARDLFWLNGIGGASPTAESRKVLERLLKKGTASLSSRPASERAPSAPSPDDVAVQPSGAGRFRVDATSRPGVLMLALSGSLGDVEMRRFVAAHKLAIETFRGQPYRVFCDLSTMAPLSPAATSAFLEAKSFSAAQPNFEGSAVLVSSSVVAMQHRRTSAESGVITTELITDDEAACWEHLRRVQRSRHEA